MRKKIEGAASHPQPAADVEYKGDLGIPEVDDCATGSFCSTCAIPPRVTGGLWSDGVGCDMCCYPFASCYIENPEPSLPRSEEGARKKCVVQRATARLSYAFKIPSTPPKRPVASPLRQLNYEASTSRPPARAAATRHTGGKHDARLRLRLRIPSWLPAAFSCYALLSPPSFSSALLFSLLSLRRV